MKKALAALLALSLVLTFSLFFQSCEPKPKENTDVNALVSETGAEAGAEKEENEPYKSEDGKETEDEENEETEKAEETDDREAEGEKEEPSEDTGAEAEKEDAEKGGDSAYAGKTTGVYVGEAEADDIFAPLE